MGYNRNYTTRFAMPCVITKKGGHLTKWFRIYLLLLEKGPMSKTEILNRLWPNRHRPRRVVDSGYCSSMFSGLSHGGWARYNPHTRKWEAYEKLLTK